MIDGQETSDSEILAIRRGWQAGLTLSQTVKRYAVADKNKAVAEWRKMKRLFSCASAPLSYVRGLREYPSHPTQAELNTIVCNIYGCQTYGDWKGITGAGKLFLDIINC